MKEEKKVLCKSATSEFELQINKRQIFLYHSCAFRKTGIDCSALTHKLKRGSVAGLTRITEAAKTLNTKGLVLLPYHFFLNEYVLSAT